MNKERYVDKMTDLVEDQLLEMGVSPYFTIEDGWEENEELSMRLYHDANGHEINFNLEELYTQKKEEDIKIKVQFRDHIKQDVIDFVNRENALGLDNSRREDEEVTRVEYEDEIEDEYDDYDDEEDYDDEYDEDFDDEEEDEYDDYEDDDEDYEDDEYDDEEDEEEEEKVSISSKVSSLLTPLKFEEVENTNGAAMVATLPTNFNGDLEKVSKRYQKQISELFEDGCFISKPNKQDVLVFDAGTFDKTDVEDIVKDLYEKGGELEVKEIEEKTNIQDRC